MAKDKAKKGPAKKEEAREEPVVIPDIPPDTHQITIDIEGYRNISRSFPISDVSVAAKYLDKDLGESQKVPVTDDEVLVAPHQFVLECDFNSSNEIDQIISNPVEFTVWEAYGSFDISAYSNVTEPSLPVPTYPGLSIESEQDLFNSFIPKKEEEGVEVKEPPPEKGKKGEKKSGSVGKGGKKDSASKSGGSIAKGKKKIPEDAKEELIDITPRIIGTCTLDLIPLFLGQDCVVQALPLVPSYRVFDENMIVLKDLPKLAVRVTVPEKWTFLQSKWSNILSFTVESMYNIPDLMNPEMDYSACTLFPMIKAEMEPVVLGNGTYKTTRDIDQVKFWPGLPKTEDLRTASNYKIDDNVEDIQNRADVNLQEILSQDVPRIEWNYIRRRYVADEGCMFLYSFFKKRRNIILEIFVKTKEPDDKSKYEALDSAKTKSSTRSGAKPKKEKTASVQQEFLHLMAVVDISALLYPGVTKIHVACPLTTYHELEALEAAGLKNSYFMPKQVEVVEEKAGKGKKERGKSAESKSSKSSAKSSKGSKKKGGKAEGPKDLKEFLPPPPPPPPEPSVKVYNEKGEPTFIILELELLQPITEKRELQDLNADLQSIFPTKPSLPKDVISSRFAEELYQETIRKLTEDLNHHYADYLKEVAKCSCSGDSAEGQSDFRTYLARIGVYPTYLNSVTKAAAVIVKDKFSYKGKCDIKEPAYRTFISEVFSYLIEEVNTVMQDIVTYGMAPPPVGSLAALDSLLLYAKEACELNADTLAERYHLERITRSEDDANHWFDYAVFLMEVQEQDKAFECVKKALAIDIKHRYSLILSALLLCDKKQFDEAETCFLSLTAEYPTWTEGWGAFLTYYKHTFNSEGEQACLSMIKKFSTDEPKISDYFSSTDDLAWSASICLHDDFFRTAVLLIKLRCFYYAEVALSYNAATKKSGIVDYLAAVICYYKKDYKLAMIHMEQAEKLHGLDHATGSLKGHCLFATGLIKEALDVYLHILHSFNRPEDAHMVYVNASIIREYLNELQEARRLTLLACKHSPTPYTWLSAGLLYYKQNDLLSAEACLTEANVCDRRMPEVWAYLTLVNVQLDRITEAELCYREAMKLELNDHELIDKMQKAIDDWKRKKVKSQ